MSSDDDVDDVETEGAAPVKGGSAKSLGLRFQKKFLGMSVKSKGVAKNFIDDTSGLIKQYGDDWAGNLFPERLRGCWRISQNVGRGACCERHCMMMRLTAHCAGALLDEMYDLAFKFTGDAKAAKKLVKVGMPRRRTPH